MLEPGAGGIDVAGQAGWSPRASPWGKRQLRGVPGGSQAAAWGRVGSGGVGSEGQPFPWGSALHGPPAAPGSPRAGDLGRERAPPVGRPERVSSHSRRRGRRDQRITRPLLGTCQENLDCSGPSSPTAGAPWGLCPCRFRPEIPWDQLGSRSWEAQFPPNPSAILIHSQRAGKGSEAIFPHADDFPLPPDRLDWIQEERNPPARFRQSDAARGSSSPSELRLRKLRSAWGRPSLSNANSVRIPGDPLSSG